MSVARCVIHFPGLSRFAHLNRPLGLWALALILAIGQTGCVSNRCDAWRPTNVANASLSQPTIADLSHFHSRDTKVDTTAELRQAFVKEPTRERAFTLAELHYAHGDRAEAV